MTSASARRLAKLEGALHPREAVLHWLAAAQQFPTILDHARSIADLPIEAAPLSVIGARVVAAIRAELKGQPRDTVERAARRAQGDAVFLFCLVVFLNGRVLEVAQLEGLRAAGAFWWMGALLGGPHDPPTSDQDAEERRDAWRSWRTLIDRLATDVRVETDARASLERQYLGGHDVLFLDAATAWASHVEMVAGLARLAEITGVVEPTKPSRRRSSVGDTRVEALADRLADDARVKAYEILGERERAVSIMERRLRA